MFHPSIQYLTSAARRSFPRYAVAVLACLLVAFAWRSPTGNLDAATKDHLPEKRAPFSSTEARLNSLRNEAASGDERSNLELSSSLMDRYDQTGDSNDLYEALEWIDRRWDVSDHEELVGRIVAKYCSHRVVKWHRLCVLGE